MEKENKQTRQLDLGLRFSKLESFYKILRLRTKIEKTFTAIPFWKNGVLWLLIITMASTIILSVIHIYSNYKSMTPEIPITWNTQKADWESTPKILIWIFPVFLVILGIVNIYFLKYSYYMNKKLNLMICFILSILFILSYLALNQIILITTT